MCQSSDSIFEVRFQTCLFYPSKCDTIRPSNFRKFLQKTEECCNRNICGNRILTGTVSRTSCSFMCAKLVIQYSMCGFRLISSTRQNVILRGMPRNVVTETFAEPSENWKVSSNRILTSGPSSSFINVKLVIHYLMYGFRPVSSTC